MYWCVLTASDCVYIHVGPVINGWVPALPHDLATLGNGCTDVKAKVIKCRVQWRLRPDSPFFSLISSSSLPFPFSPRLCVCLCSVSRHLPDHLTPAFHQTHQLLFTSSTSPVACHQIVPPATVVTDLRQISSAAGVMFSEPPCFLPVLLWLYYAACKSPTFMHSHLHNSTYLQ